MAKVRSSLERLSALPPDCCNCAGATDQSSVIMTFQPAGGTDVKKIDHYEGCEKTPDWLYDVENAIDAALETERWSGKEGRRQTAPPASTTTALRLYATHAVRALRARIRLARPEDAQLAD